MSFRVTGIDRLMKAMTETNRDLPKTGREGIAKAIKFWSDEAREIALKDTGKLRQGLKPLGSIEQNGDELEGTIVSNAYRKGFNYAYYWHFYGLMPNNPTTPNTTGTPLKQTGIQLNDKILAQLEKEIQREFKRKGW